MNLAGHKFHITKIKFEETLMNNENRDHKLYSHHSPPMKTSQTRKFIISLESMWMMIDHCYL